MKEISTNELREMYQLFFESKGHVRIPSAPLIPENDPSVLFTTAGMHPLVPYLKGESHPQGKRLTNVQICLRTTDIDEVGDDSHATVFEMLGNWSLGDYFKTEAIEYSWEFLTADEWLGIEPKRLAVSVFAGDDQNPRDEEAAKIWQEIGVPTERIAYLGKDDNWWPSVAPVVGPLGPQGPDTEIFYWVDDNNEPPVEFNPTADGWVEIWNDVFMQYNRTENGGLDDLAQKNVDTGMGLERVVMILNGKSSIYEIDSYEKLMKLISRAAQNSNLRYERIIADHIKTAAFVLGDINPVIPSNTEQGYVLRRLIRRAVIFARRLGFDEPAVVMEKGLELIINEYGDNYPSLRSHAERAKVALLKEVEVFNAVIKNGLKLFEKVKSGLSKGGTIDGETAFKLHATHGFPIELTEELAEEHKLTIDVEGYKKAQQMHQEKSRKAAAGKFSGGLTDHSERSVKYHTATHLLHQALREVLGEHVMQKGSNITPDRLRFDFSHQTKLTPGELLRVEEIVNERIKENLPVTKQETTVAEAKKMGALGLFEDKYGDKVSVYCIGDWSKEICGGPHVSNTEGMGAFKVIKEEAVGAGVRRIKATLE